MTQITDIRARLHAATGPARELDEIIFHYAHGRKRSISTFEQYDPSERLPAYTASVDACLALVATKLPGKHLYFCSGPGHQYANIQDDEGYPEMAMFAPTLPLAILRALFDTIRE